MFEAVGKVFVILLLVTFGLVALTFGAGWILVYLLPVLVFAVPIAIVIWIIVKVVKA